MLLLLCVGAIEAQTRFKPIDKRAYEIWEKRTFSKYYNKDTKCQFIVSPSFTHSYALYVSDYKDRNSKTFAYNYTNILAAKDAKGEIHKISKLCSLMKHVVNTSMYSSNRMGNDGVEYFIFAGSDGAMSWTPIDNNRIVVNTLENIYKAVVNGNQAEIDAQMPRIDSLTIVYKKLYPDDFYTGYNMGAHSWSSTKKEFPETYCVWGSFLDDLLMVDFVIPQEWYEDKERYNPYKLVKKHAPVLEAVGRYLHNETSLLEINGVYFMVNNNKPYGYDKNRKCFNVHEDDLTEERLKEIIVKEIFKIQ